MQPTSNALDVALTNPPVAPPPPGEARSRVTIEQLAQLGPMAADDRRVAWVNSVVDADIQRQSYATDMALARQFALSGKFDDLKDATPEQAVATAMVKIQLGRAWGFNAADSMKNIYFINGRPALEQDIVASKLQAAGFAWEPDFVYEDVAATKVTRAWRKCTGCTLWLKQFSSAEQRYQPMLNRAGEQVSVSFTLADAENAKYWEKGQEKPLADKFNYRSYPSDMYYWRCISRVRKYYAPGVLRGSVLREEALEMMPADLAPDQLPRELQPPDALPQPEKKTFADRVKDGEVGPAFTQEGQLNLPVE
jgi:hypothetical protein